MGEEARSRMRTELGRGKSGARFGLDLGGSEEVRGKKKNGIGAGRMQERIDRADMRMTEGTRE